MFMRPRLVTSMLSSAALLLTTSACQLSFASGNGAVVTEAREVGAFRRVSVENGMTALITTGSRAVTVKTDQNLQALVETVVVGEVLFVRVKPGTTITNSGALEATVANDAIEGLAASGAARVTSEATATTAFVVDASGASSVTVAGVSASSIAVNASGASHVTMTGGATSANLSASGASGLDVKAVPLTSATIDLSGASSLRASVSGSLSGSLSGASTASITGTPTTAVATSGGSTISTGAP
jgi:hypothetical protein